MEFVKKSINKWIMAAVILVIGILCIVAAAASGNAQMDAYAGISMTIGISLIVVSSLSVLLALIATIVTKGETSFGIGAIGSAFTLALGIFFVCDKGLGGNLIWILLNYVPFVMLVVGSIFALDGILLLIFGIVKKNVKASAIAAIFELVIAAVTILLGALMVGDSPVISKNAQLIIFGIILIIYALLLCAITFLPLLVKDQSVITVKVEDVKDVDNNENENATENTEKAE